MRDPKNEASKEDACIYGIGSLNIGAVKNVVLMQHRKIQMAVLKINVMYYIIVNPKNAQNHKIVINH